MDTLIRPARYTETFGRAAFPSMPGKVLIGHRTLHQDTEFTHDLGTPAWTETVLVPAGTYAVTSNGYWAFVTYNGTILQKSTPTLYGGVRQNTGDHPEQVGKPGKHFTQMYVYSVAELFANKDSDWTPLSNVESVLTGWCEHMPPKGSTTMPRHASPMFGLVVH